MGRVEALENLAEAARGVLEVSQRFNSHLAESSPFAELREAIRLLDGPAETVLTIPHRRMLQEIVRLSADIRREPGSGRNAERGTDIMNKATGILSQARDEYA